MTLMEENIPVFKPRLAIWPRGSVLFATNLRGLGAGPPPSDSILLALRFIVYHFHHQRNRLVTYGDWLRIATVKINLSRECGFLLFTHAQSISPVNRERRVSNFQNENEMETKADILGLAVALALMACPVDANGNRDACRYIKDNLELFLDCILLCNYSLATENISSSRIEKLPRLGTIPATALSNLDVLFEGTLRTDKQTSTSSVIPTSISALLMAVFGLELKDKISMTDLLSIFAKSLQSDMFSLDDVSCHNCDESTGRTMTSTQLAEHRKVTVRRWRHVELLTKLSYRNANLRIKGPFFDESAFFCPRVLKTALIKNAQNTGPIVLGPVTGLVVLDGLEDITVSVICDKILIQNCRGVTVFLNCKTSPVIGRNSTSVLLAPYNVFFDGLFHELQHAGMLLLSGTENRWDQPIQCNSLRYSESAVLATVNWSLLPVEAFYIQPTPFPTNKDSAMYNYFRRTIPSLYLENFEERLHSAEAWLQRNPENRLISVSEADQQYLYQRTGKNMYKECVLKCLNSYSSNTYCQGHNIGFLPHSN
ncbi:unnamed protein product [Bursaphelenchus okinawaensis]|uniref:C-CAP/cofactor C-like domain-containing protein n=1 Tax=Bursaphelenchus okinawaensis TaxID=465554 RepID=A0A811JQ80_9BILA|nr:unnamed protein product [Bursaphelenchus okinawaensis]CAG9077310.1 unnamed protein product [Bursaphelenchus okinawaensis]